MEKRTDNPRDLGEIINEGKPAKVFYELGEGEKRTELILTIIQRNSTISNISNRISSSPLIELYEAAGGISMDITDPEDNSYAYRGIRPHGATYKQPDNPPHELGDLEVDLGEDALLAISQFQRDK